MRDSDWKESYDSEYTPAKWTKYIIHKIKYKLYMSIVKKKHTEVLYFLSKIMITTTNIIKYCPKKKKRTLKSLTWMDLQFRPSGTSKLHSIIKEK